MNSEQCVFKNCRGFFCRLLFIVNCSLFIGTVYAAQDYDYDSVASAQKQEQPGPDTFDPMYLTESRHLLSHSNLSVAESVIALRQKFSFGVYENLAIAADIRYQQDINGPEDGFSGIGLSAAYRLNGDGKILSDILGGINFGGKTRVPDYADTVYSLGWRVGRQWSWITLAGTVQSSWIFDETRGMAYIDFMPDVYFRFTDHWSAGTGFDFRKATNPNFDDTFGKVMAAYRVGRTMYSGKIEYGFRQEEVKVGAALNILF